MIPVLQTERLTLRGPELGDFETLARFFETPRSAWVGGPATRDQVWTGFSAQAGQWMLRGYGFWQVVETASGTLIGRAGIYHPENWPEPELSWSLYDDTFEGQGFAQEMAKAALQGAASLGVTRPISSVVPDNHRSIRLALRLGATPEGEWETPYGPMLKFRHMAPK